MAKRVRVEPSIDTRNRAGLAQRADPVRAGRLRHADSCCQCRIGHPTVLHQCGEDGQICPIEGHRPGLRILRDVHGQDPSILWILRQYWYVKSVSAFSLATYCEITNGGTMFTEDLHLDSVAVHAGRDDLNALGVHALPLDFSSTNPLPDIESGGTSYEMMATGGEPHPEGGSVYARLWNPTVARFEVALARMEHAPAAVAFSSGMAAMTAAILATSHGSSKHHIVAVRPLYGGTDHLLASGLLRREVTFCDAVDVASEIRTDTAMI